MTSDMLSGSPNIDPEIIDRALGKFAELSEGDKGVTRLAYTELERRAHRVFAERLSEFGIEVWVDAAGNTIGELAPSDPYSDNSERGAIATGSHLDSVPSGGRFDGIVGVVAALEVARLCVVTEIPRKRPWRFVAFAAEEGSRFARACNGSRAISGATTTGDLKSLRDGDGLTMFDAMTGVGLRPNEVDEAQWSDRELEAFVELHVEQGSVLEEAGIPIGVVQTIAGSVRFEVLIEGLANHSGASPMEGRQDALAVAAECVLIAQRLARQDPDKSLRITVGRLQVFPNSLTSIPGKTRFFVDIRDSRSDQLEDAAARVRDGFESIARSYGVTVSLVRVSDAEPTPLSVRVSSVIEKTATSLGIHHMSMFSGASHDAQQIVRVGSSGMIFVPSQSGISHAPTEYTCAADVATGAKLLFESMKELDRGSN